MFSISGTTTRLATKPDASSTLITANAQAMKATRAARRPVESKKIGLSAMFYLRGRVSVPEPDFSHAAGAAPSLRVGDLDP